MFDFLAKVLFLSVTVSDYKVGGDVPTLRDDCEVQMQLHLLP